MLTSAVRSRVPRRGAAVLFTAVAGTAILVGCGAGQQAQTAAKDPSVPGVNATVQGIALRNLQVGYPGRERRSYPEGGNAPLEARIFNSGTRTDALIGVRSDTAEHVVLVESSGEASGVCREGRVSLPPTQPASQPSVTPPGTVEPTPGDTSETAQPDTELPAGNPEFSIDLAPGACALLLRGQPYHLELAGLREELGPGSVVPVTFTFQEAGELTVNVPFGLPSDGPEHSPLDIHPPEPPALGDHDTGGHE